MNRFLFIIIAILLVASCKSREVIPPDVLEEIIEQTALTTATINTIDTIRDSVSNMNYYAPVLEKYGYTVDDFRYTIEKMIARRSRVLNHVLQKAIVDIKVKYETAQYLYSMKRDLEILIDAYYLDTLYKIDNKFKLIRNTGLDATELYLPLHGAGEYTLRIYYATKSISKHRNYYLNAQLQDSISNLYVAEKQSEKYNYYKRGKDISYDALFVFRWSVGDENLANLIKLNMFSGGRIDGKPDVVNKAKKNKDGKLPWEYHKRPNIVVDSVILTKRPLFTDAMQNLIDYGVGYEIKQEILEKPKYFRIPYTYSPVQFADTIEVYKSNKLGVEKLFENRSKDYHDIPPSQFDYSRP